MTALPIVAGLEAYWDWAGAAPFRSRVGGHTLAQGDGADVAVVGVTDGPCAAALAFDGAKDYLVIPAGCEGRLNLGAGGYRACTVFAWIERDTTTGAIIAGCWQEDDGDPRRQYALFTGLGLYGGQDRVCGHVSRTGGPTPGYPYSRDYAANARPIRNGAWQFVAFTYDGAEVRAHLGPAFEPRPSYTDGLGATYAKNPYAFAAGLNAAPCDFTVGACKLTFGMWNFYRGRLGPLGIYNRALSLAELTTLHRSFLAPSEPVYRFDLAIAAPDSDCDGQMLAVSPDLDGVALDAIRSVNLAPTPAASGAALRLVIRSGGAWYASDRVSSPEAGEATFAFGRRGADWRDLGVTPGAAPSLAGAARAADLPGGTLEAIGCYGPAGAVEAVEIRVFCDGSAAATRHL